jgi:hypothetical protein
MVRPRSKLSENLARGNDHAPERGRISPVNAIGEVRGPITVAPSDHHVEDLLRPPSPNRRSGFRSILLLCSLSMPNTDPKITCFLP